jgi:hypothetical protein
MFISPYRRPKGLLHPAWDTAESKWLTCGRASGAQVLDVIANARVPLTLSATTAFCMNPEETPGLSPSYIRRSLRLEEDCQNCHDCQKSPKLKKLIETTWQSGECRLLKREIADAERCFIGGVHNLSPAAQSCCTALAGRNLKIGS